MKVLSYMKLVGGVKKIGDRWFRPKQHTENSTEGTLVYTTKLDINAPAACR